MKTHIRNGGTRKNPLHGFTLTELLVTIAMIAVLAALAFLATGKIRAKAQQTNAISALRQIATANLAYSAENNGAINVIRDPGEWGSRHEGPGSRYASNSFVGRMQPYLFSGINTETERTLQTDTLAAYARLFNTKDIKSMAGTAFSGVPVYADGSGIHNPISVNIKLRPVWNQPPRRLSGVADPARTLYLTYGRYYFDVLQGSAYSPLPLPDDRRRTIYYLPNRKAIVCFLDGHVEMISPPISEDLFE
jgi:prepilin-type N-terminal cleavage/methylation domain-containing protein/prepilin-type processing-associated H-X9-DG protein